MLPYQERVIAEKQELEERMDKLQAFMDTDTFAQMPNEEKNLLNRQLDIMREFRSILATRISHF